MSPADRRLWLGVQRRAALLQPDVAKALLDAWRTISASLSDVELTRLVTSGQIDQILDDALLDRSFLSLRARLREVIEKGFTATIKELPRAGKVEGTQAVMFDTLSPKVIDGVRKLDSRVINTLKEEVRETVRAHVENGLRDGRAPATVARELRSVIGLAPNQERAVENYRRALEGDPDAGDPLSRALRDKRFDTSVRRGELTPEQIEKMTAAYRRKFVAFNANTNAKTATLDSYKLGQKLSWQEARDKGLIVGTLTKTWVTVGDARVRDEHVEMQGETVPFDNVYSNGEDIPGESTFNCRCLSRIKVHQAA